jgi:superfamily II DNA or RNA helicase/HKD family nuclease
MTITPGAYDKLLTEEFQRQADASRLTIESDEVEGSDATSRLLDHAGHMLGQILAEMESAETEGVRRQAHLVLELLQLVREKTKAAAVELPVTPLRRVLAVTTTGIPADPPPLTGLSAPWLFTAAKGSPTLYEEIRREAATCDSIDVLVSFITVSGVRKLLDVLQRVTAPGPDGKPSVRLRVLTTTYTGATEQAALDMLARLTGCELRVSLDGRRTRLHAKSWLFGRATGFGSAYIGSANLSGAALLGGLEWTVKITERSQKLLFKRARAHFESLWEDDEFVPYNPYDASSVAALRTALKLESGSAAETRYFFDITPKQYQAEILEQLAFERAHGRRRNLVVAATGTGKTVIAALDYRRNAASGSRPRLLFVAHRRELLEQALATYRAVLRDGSFGELLVGGERPSSYEHVFCTVQSLASQALVERFGASYWHTVVIDECHRIVAPQFDAFASTIRPKVLLGLTATPERTDGKPLSPYFDMRPDGSPAAELRLWQALDLQLLSPFEYFGCNDETDFSDVRWDSPGELAAVDQLVTGNQVRARLIVNEWARLTDNPRKSRALIFCVSVAHARFMVDQFAKANLPVALLHGGSSAEERRAAPRALERGELCGIVTVDLFNEGVDLPFIDTLLFLRPTQSPVVFQQQLGRGLRLAEGKSTCLVLDFIGRHRAGFRYDRLLSSITGLTRREVIAGVKDGFSTLPSGCHIHLERQARERVLESLNVVAGQSWARLRSELMSYANARGRQTVRLSEFLRDQSLELGEVYRESAPSGWTSLRRAAGLLTGTGDDADDRVSHSLRLLTHVDDARQIEVMRTIAERGPEYVATTAEERLRAQMLAYQVDSKTICSYSDFSQRIGNSFALRSELEQLADALEVRSRVVTQSLPGFEGLPLLLHARYERREILTALGWHTASARPAMREGVLSLTDRKLQVLFVTLDKTTGFHERIRFRDYAVSTTRFHWETQNSVGPETQVGQRYKESPANGWRFLLFVRETPDHAFFSCGPVSVRAAGDISGSRPMSIVWTLETPLPVGTFRAFNIDKGA